MEGWVLFAGAAWSWWGRRGHRGVETSGSRLKVVGWGCECPTLLSSNFERVITAICCLDWKIDTGRSAGFLGAGTILRAALGIRPDDRFLGFWGLGDLCKPPSYRDAMPRTS